MCQSLRCLKGWVTERKFQMEGGVAHQPLLVTGNWSDCSFVWHQSICSALFGFVTKYACDRQMDRQTELRLPRPC